MGVEVRLNLEQGGWAGPTTASSSVMGSGSVLPHCYRARPQTEALQHGTIACFSKSSSGEGALAFLGGIHTLALANGTASSAPSDGGQTAGCCSGCSRPSVAIPIWSLAHDGAIASVHQKASGATGGLSISPLADPGAG